MTFRPIEFGSEYYQQECELRNAVLRRPLGLSLDDEDAGLERKQLHFGWFDERAILIGCVIAVPLSSTEAKIRQMAVASEYQGLGHGRRILLCLESHLLQLGFTHLSLHARLTATGFYEKMGYTIAGPEFMEVNIPHVKMEKAIPR